MKINNYRSVKINAILNSIKQCCSILFPLITFPYVSRVLGDDGFGKYSFAMSIVNYLILFAGLGINTYAVREGARIRDDRTEINKLASELFSINVVFSILAYIILWLLFTFSEKINSYKEYILILSVSIVLICIGMEWVNNIFEDFFFLICRYIFIQVVALCLMFACIKSKQDVAKYCIIAIFATYGGNLINVFYVRRYVGLKFTFHMNFKKHIVPLVVLFVNQLAITIYVNSDITMLGYYYPDSIVGQYSLASKVYTIIKQLINAAVVVTLPRISYLLSHDKKKFEPYLSKIISGVMGLIFPIVTGLFLLARPILLITGGSDYIGAMGSLQILSFAVIFSIFGTIMSYGVLISCGHEKECLISTAITATVNVGLNFVLLPILGIEGAALTTIIAEAMNLFIQLAMSKKIIRIRFPFKIAFQYIIACIPIGLICIFCEKYITNIVLEVLIAILLSVFLYAILLILFKNEFIISFIDIAKKRLPKRR